MDNVQHKAGTSKCSALWTITRGSFNLSAPSNVLWTPSRLNSQGNLTGCMAFRYPETHPFVMRDSRDVFMAVKIQDPVLWVVTQSSVVVGYQRFGEPCCLHLLGCDTAKCYSSVSNFRWTLLRPSSNKSGWHSWWNQEQIKFRECLLLFSPKSFVFSSRIKKPED
jgi:hypothetical protein